MNRIHDNEVNSIAECNLLHDILNTSKRTRSIVINHPPIMDVLNSGTERA